MLGYHEALRVGPAQHHVSPLGRRETRTYAHDIRRPTADSVVELLRLVPLRPFISSQLHGLRWVTVGPLPTLAGLVGDGAVRGALLLPHAQTGLQGRRLLLHVQARPQVAPLARPSHRVGRLDGGEERGGGRRHVATAHVAHPRVRQVVGMVRLHPRVVVGRGTPIPVLPVIRLLGHLAVAIAEAGSVGIGGLLRVLGLGGWWGACLLGPLGVLLVHGHGKAGPDALQVLCVAEVRGGGGGLGAGGHAGAGALLVADHLTAPTAAAGPGTAAAIAIASGGSAGASGGWAERSRLVQEEHGWDANPAEGRLARLGHDHLSRAQTESEGVRHRMELADLLSTVSEVPEFHVSLIVKGSRVTLSMRRRLVSTLAMS